MPFEPSSAPLRERLMDAFDEMVLYKDLSKGSIISSLKLPSFMRDWVMKQFQDEEGHLDIDEVGEYIRTYIPKKRRMEGHSESDCHAK